MNKIKKSVLNINNGGLKFVSFLFILFLVLAAVGLNYPKSNGKIMGIDRESTKTKRTYEVGAWYWKSPDEIQTAELSSIINFCKKEGINTIYIEVGKYLDIVDDTGQLENFNKKLSEFIKAANRKNINVQALSGATNWAEETHKYLPLKLLDFAESFNKKFPETKLSGIQFDIEFYNDESYFKNKNQKMTDFLDLTQKIIDKTNSKKDLSEKFSVGFAVPYWMDTNKGALPKLVYKEINDEFMKHFLKILEGGKNTYIAIMAYRNFVTGGNGVIDIVSGEFEYLKSNSKNVSVVIGQETSNAEEEGTHVSYFRKSKKELKKNILQIEKTFRDYESLKGFAIHDLESYQKLKPE